MSSATENHTYWCHECDMSVTLSSPQSSSNSSSSSSSSLLCPHCLTDFLEHMDFTTPPTTTAAVDFDFPSFIMDPLPTFPFSNDNYLLNSPQFLRLFQNLTDSSDPFPSPSRLQSIPTIQISSTMLDRDPILICAICKDQFLLNVDAKQLPCSHLYHPDCILPWLSNHNSCPLCRFTIPGGGPGNGSGNGDSEFVSWRRARMAIRFRELLSREDSYGLRSTIRHIARRHTALYSAHSAEDAADAGIDIDIGTGDRTDTVETVSTVTVNGGDDIVHSGAADELITEDVATLV